MILLQQVRCPNLCIHIHILIHIDIHTQIINNIDIDIDRDIDKPMQSAGRYHQPIQLQDHDQQPSGLASAHKQAPQHNQPNLQYLALLAFVLLIAGIVIFKVFVSYDAEALDGRFYNQQLMSLELIDFWKMDHDELEKQQNQPNKDIIDESSEHKITRQQLGRQSWSLLHMITGGFPETFDDTLRKKFNTFLVLFGQMYPCKMCANHFMELLKKQGLFQGNTKKQLMQYLCRIHNKVNQRLGHPIHDCSNVVQEWNTCGCSGQPTL